ncbi:hypothetical protein ACFQVA_23880 [Actinomadura keratinilytica]
MSALLTGIGTRIAERWLQTVVLASLLWVAALVISVRLGHAHPFDAGRLSAWLDEIARDRAGRSFSAVALAVASGLLAAAPPVWRPERSAGRSNGCGAPPVPGPRCPGWCGGAGAAAATGRAGPSRHRPDLLRPASGRTAGTRLRPARGPRRKPHRPERPTRIGDLFHRAAVRVHRRHALDLEPAWPRLWALLPETLRADITGARQAYDSAARLVSWAVLYAALAVLWWPGALVAAAVLATAVGRARVAASLLATLVETAVDLHLTDLAERLGVRGGEDTPAGELGRAVARRLA